MDGHYAKLQTTRSQAPSNNLQFSASLTENLYQNESRRFVKDHSGHIPTNCTGGTILTKTCLGGGKMTSILKLFCDVEDSYKEFEPRLKERVLNDGGVYHVISRRYASHQK